MISRPVVDLPQPDSPTSPSEPPSTTSKETPSTAWTWPTVRWMSPLDFTGKYIRRLSTVSSGFASSGASVAACASNGVRSSRVGELRRPAVVGSVVAGVARCLGRLGRRARVVVISPAPLVVGFPDEVGRDLGRISVR